MASISPFPMSRQILLRQIRRGVTLYGWLCPEWITLRMKLAIIHDDMKQNSGHTQTHAVKPVIYISGSVIPFNVCYIEFGFQFSMYTK